MRNEQIEDHQEEGFERHIPLIRDIVCRVARRRGLDRDEIDEFNSYVMLRFVESDWAPLRQFSGRSTLRTYLVTVVCRQFLDYRIRLWGRWRPSARASCLGPVAVRLERLVNCEKRSVREALEMIRSEPGSALTEDELLNIARQLPHRASPRFDGETDLDQLASDACAEERLLDRDRRRLIEKVTNKLAQALQGLPEESRRMLEMRYGEGLQVRRIAEILETDSKPLYRQFERCLRALRCILEREGLSKDDVMGLIGCPEDPWDAGLILAGNPGPTRE